MIKDLQTLRKEKKKLREKERERGKERWREEGKRDNSINIKNIKML